MLEANDAHVVKWWVDASFAVHQDKRSHIGGTMSLGKRLAYSTSTHHKIQHKKFHKGRAGGCEQCHATDSMDLISP